MKSTMLLFLKKSLLSVKFGLFLMALFVSVQSFAQPAITLSKVDPSCSADGEITVNVTNSTGTVLYMLAAPSPVQTTPQNSNHFSGLPPGEYTVHVYDNVANEAPVTATITLTSTYKMFILESVTPSNDVTGPCLDDGYIRISASGGKRPYTYEIESGPVTRPPQTSNTFYNLPTDSYSVRVKDACGASVGGSANVTSLYNLAGREFAHINTTALAVTYDECTNKASVYIHGTSIDLRDQYNKIITFNKRNGMQYRVEYPAGSGEYSAWTTDGGARVEAAITADNIAGTTYGRLQVKHPCTGIVTTTGNLTVRKFTPIKLSVGKQVVRDICTSYPYISTVYGSDICTPNRVVIEEVGNESNSITFFDYKTSHVYNSNDPSAPSTTYKFGFEWNQTYKFTHYNSADVEVSSSTFAMGAEEVRPITTASYLTHYDYRYDRYDVNWELPGNPASQPVTITVTAGPSHIGDVFTSTASRGRLSVGDTPVNDFVPGEYVFRFDFANGCPSIDHSHTIEQGTIGGELQYIDYTAGAFCGNFNLKVKWAYLDMNGNPISTHPSIRVAKYKVYVDGKYSLYADSNAELLVKNLSSGPHRIEIYPYFASPTDTEVYKLVDMVYTIPEYTLPVFNVAQSGGAVCSGSKGSIHVEVTGLEPLQYQIKKKGDPDTNYSALQSSPDFVDLDPGSYIVRVKDGCGNEMPQEVMLVSTAGSSAIDASSATTDNKVCLGNPVTLMLKPVGPFSSVTWTKPDGTTTNDMLIVIPNFRASNAGTYHVEINSASGCIISSSLDVALAPEINLAVTNPPSNMIVDITDPAVTAGSTPAGLTYEYYTDAACNNALTAPEAVTTSGIYYIKATSADGCTAVAPVNVTIVRNLIMTVEGSSSINEGEVATIKIATEGNVNTVKDIVINLTYVSNITTTPNISLTPGSAAATVTIPAGSSFVTFDITANNDLLLEGLEVVTITATTIGEITMKPGADIIDIDVKDLTNGTIVVEKVRDAEESGVDGIFSIHFSEAGVKSTTKTRVDVEIVRNATTSENDFVPLQEHYIIPEHTNAIEVNLTPKNNYIVEGGSREVTMRLTGAASI